MNHTLMDTRGSISVGSLLTDTQGRLIITQQNRQQGQQLKTIRLERDRRRVGDKDKREANNRNKSAVQAHTYMRVFSLHGLSPPAERPSQSHNQRTHP